MVIPKLTKSKCFNCWETFWDFDETKCYCKSCTEGGSKMSDEPVKNEVEVEEEVEDDEDEGENTPDPAVA